MSKSVGNVVDPIELAELYGVDALRYFLLREVSFGQDGTFSDDAIVTRANADLANGLGNLAQRCLAMIAKNCDGVVPAPDADVREPWLGNLSDHVSELMTELRLNETLETIWEGVRNLNGYFAEMEPWALRKTDPAMADAVLYHTAEHVRQLAILVHWAIPASADVLLDQLGQNIDARDWEALKTPLAPGTRLPVPKGIFPRLELAA
jgi:methionyl-tRNA synthetase